MDTSLFTMLSHAIVALLAFFVSPTLARANNHTLNCSDVNVGAAWRRRKSLCPTGQLQRARRARRARRIVLRSHGRFDIFCAQRRRSRGRDRILEGGARTLRQRNCSRKQSIRPRNSSAVHRVRKRLGRVSRTVRHDRWVNLQLDGCLRARHVEDRATTGRDAAFRVAARALPQRYVGANRDVFSRNRARSRGA